MRAPLIIIACGLALAACKPETAEVPEGAFDPSKIVYYQDGRTGVCFAVAAYARLDTGGKWSGGQSHATVPCSPAVTSLLRK